MSNYTPKRSGSGAGTRQDKDAKMKKGLVIAILAVLGIIIAAAMVIVFVPGAEESVSGFFSGNGGAKYVPETQGETTIISQYYDHGILPTTGSRHDITVINGGGANAADMIGAWRLDDVTQYVFDGKGRGIMLTAVDNYTFLYSAQDGKIAIDFDSDGGADREYDYVIEGDVLTLTNGAQKFVFKRAGTP